VTKLNSVEKSKFVLKMHGEEGRCAPCFKAKDGPVNEISNELG
jgi:hypothetical protein